MKTENKVSHTPGPWKVVEMCKPHSSFYKSFWIQTDQYLIAEAEVKHGLTNEQAEANARLIAAAPDMLKALEDLLNDKAPSYHDCIDDGLDECAWCIASKTIAKAKGETT